MADQSLANPYADTPGYNCFGCAPGNAAGLSMTFTETDRGVQCVWEPRSDLTGYPGVVHGGVQATMIDETASWYTFVKLATAGVTAAMNVVYHRPLLTEKGPVTVEAVSHTATAKRAHITVELRDADGTLCTVGECEYAIFPPEVARRRMHYPGPEAFRA